jgi:taurine dioxygenase|tara:strand:+ start:592 stop:765 length:174 start_codon:yes stop_codon:yes gene_type:complete
MQVKLLSGALGSEIDGINLKDILAKNFELINNLLFEHKVLFFRNQNISSEEQIALDK